MALIALKMLWGDTSKYLALVFGVAFATLLMTNQVSIFWSLMLRTASLIDTIPEVVWVMDPRVRHIDEIEPTPDETLRWVAGVPGVLWAAPLFKSLSVLRTGDGRIQQAILVGVDDDSLFGAPNKLIAGQIEDLRRFDAVFIDRPGWDMLWPHQPFHPGVVIEFADRRAEIVGLANTLPTFQTYPVITTRYSNALRYSGSAMRKPLSFILAGAAPGRTEAVAQAITAATGLKALSSDGFARATIVHYLTATGIPINFAATVTIGFVIGVIIVAQMLHIFVHDNLRHFATLKAVGFDDRAVVRMVLLQTAVVAGIGYGLGVGLCGLFFIAVDHTVDVMRGFRLDGAVIAGAAVAVVLITGLASLASLRRALRVDPAVLFNA